MSNTKLILDVDYLLSRAFPGLKIAARHVQPIRMDGRTIQITIDGPDVPQSLSGRVELQMRSDGSYYLNPVPASNFAGENMFYAPPPPPPPPTDIGSEFSYFKIFGPDLLTPKELLFTVFCTLGLMTMIYFIAIL